MWDLIVSVPDHCLSSYSARRKFAALDEAYNVFHAPIYRYIVFELLL